MEQNRTLVYVQPDGIRLLSVGDPSASESQKANALLSSSVPPLLKPWIIWMSLQYIARD